ncbi:hypothetical protein SmJEL517_g01561 [Synchytrium microbalum]|uniref:Late endosomal/lysosomal adaptor and MAPK and MTOR activator 5 n=1 Tax=Synchytrium microbalum TaxID=1806994 RepID=A0A507C3R9_9FUNG|nr:uncharacterized protein SmJEL517_g01561 [Synchytrium microbalum]TPX36180.1 hypothetical protein SmJEL517_g01561 [Synchytrium microbalum]
MSTSEQPSDAEKLLSHLMSTIPDQTGIIVASLDGSILASSGTLQDDRTVVSEALGIVKDARNLVASSSERDRMKRVTSLTKIVKVGDQLIAITADDKLLYVVNRTPQTQ